MAERFSDSAGANAFVPAAAARRAEESDLSRKTCAVLRLYRALSRRGCGDDRALFGFGRSECVRVRRRDSFQRAEESDLSRKTCAVLRLYRALSRRGCGDGRALFGRVGARKRAPNRCPFTNIRRARTSRAARGRTRARSFTAAAWPALWTAARLYRGVSRNIEQACEAGLERFAPFSAMSEQNVRQRAGQALKGFGSVCRGDRLLQHRE